ncbi:hypothetical protein B0H11DRAFT_2241125 [Mycena galericulata]|nr:hypothetical protein B0H11DRAFT_2241125 [Mycena galericulata]
MAEVKREKPSTRTAAHGSASFDARCSSSAQQQAQYAHQHIPASFDMRPQSRPMRTDRAALRAPRKPTRPRPLRLRRAHAAAPLRELRLGRGVTPIPTGNAIDISLIIAPITDVGDVSNIDIPMLGVGDTDIPIPPAELGDIPIAAQHFDAIPAHPHSKRAGLGLDESLLMGGMGMGMKYPEAAMGPADGHGRQRRHGRRLGGGEPAAPGVPPRAAAAAAAHDGGARGDGRNGGHGGQAQVVPEQMMREG